MGIPHYFRKITQTYEGIIGLVQPVTDHVFFDFNGAIHQSAKKILDQIKAKSKTVSIMDMYEETSAGNRNDDEIPPIEKDIMEEVETYVRNLVQFVKPKKSVYIYMDGVAPHAKLMQQRKRRYLALFRHKLMGTKPIWDTNAISPGTLFMIRLAGYLKSRLRDRPLHSGITRLSFSDETGEAEHKIFASLASIPRDEKVIIHGLDADLIMLSLLSHRPNITLMREPHEGADFQFLYIDKLREGILHELATKYMWPIAGPEGVGMFDEQACHAIESYVVWCFFLGNDFLPHLPTLHLQKNGLEKILMAAQHTMLVNSSHATIDWDIIYNVLEELSKDETDTMRELIREFVHKKCHAKTDDEKADMYPLLEQNKSKLATELYSSHHFHSWKSTYYKTLFHTRMHDTSIITDACREYMTGIEWTYRYYKRLARDPCWYYPFCYAPTMLDLTNHISILKDKHLGLLEQWNNSYTTPTFVPDYIQLLCILPPESIHLIPLKLRELLTNPVLGCTHMFPVKYPIHTFLKMRLWECTPVLPTLNISLLETMTLKMITQIEKIKPRAKLTKDFAEGFHIAPKNGTIAPTYAST